MQSIQTLKSTPFKTIAEVFNDAFSNYQIPVRLDENSLSKMFKIRDISLEHSFGFFDNDRIQGFALHGIRSKHGQYSAYNSGMGVVSKDQGMGIGNQLLQHSIQFFKQDSYKNYSLEVLTENEPAINLYKKHGLEIIRTLDCFAADSISSAEESKFQIHSSQVNDQTIESFQSLSHHSPSWQNTSQSIINNQDHCTSVCSNNDGIPVAYLIIDNDSGGIHQIGFNSAHPNAAKTLLKQALLDSKTNKLSVINLERSDKQTRNLIEAAGFTHTVSQFEMGWNE